MGVAPSEEEEAQEIALQQATAAFHARIVDYAAASDDEERTGALVEVAYAIVQLRRLFTTQNPSNPDGPLIRDWLGKSNGYRRYLSEQYELAPVPGATVDRIKVSVRYHVGRILPGEVPAADQAALGMYRQALVHRRKRQVNDDDVREALRAALGRLDSGLAARQYSHLCVVAAQIVRQLVELETPEGEEADLSLRLVVDACADLVAQRGHASAPVG